MSRLFNRSRKTSRLQNWDYKWKGLYFITINTKFGENYFGEIILDQLKLNEIGKVVTDQWLLIPSIRPDMHLILDEFIVMPNHFHGIIGIGRNEFNVSPDSAYEFQFYKDVDKENRSAFQPEIDMSVNSFGPQCKNLGSIIRGFKGAVTSWCRNNHKLFDWHSRYHDVIIRNEVQLHKVRSYIQANPFIWHRDRFNKKR